ncbi:hypothetical protein QBC34DRAFT_110601 [Podospora aff. communis PSN243]|uniref:Uncharacterized protein n=1 Tax=Podospora aff. communis PSN243 TaxID=3040156 RepID=A0AAV9GM81_9PEZI|nr:hypothetical protein QBC34DRAFT_110601 [Podospora aff. communis PSN243]
MMAITRPGYDSLACRGSLCRLRLLGTSHGGCRIRWLLMQESQRSANGVWGLCCLALVQSDQSGGASPLLIWRLRSAQTRLAGRHINGLSPPPPLGSGVTAARAPPPLNPIHAHDTEATHSSGHSRGPRRILPTRYFCLTHRRVPIASSATFCGFRFVCTFFPDTEAPHRKSPTCPPLLASCPTRHQPQKGTRIPRILDGHLAGLKTRETTWPQLSSCAK